MGRTEEAPLLSDTLGKVHAKVYSDRIQLINRKKYRLEELASSRDIPEISGVSEVICFSVMNFREGHGPGKADHHTPLESINYDGGSPGEDTAVLYDPTSGYMAIQYAHSGPRHSAIQRYLNAFLVEGAYELKPKFDTEFERKFQTQRHLTRIETKIDTSQVSEEDLKANQAAQHIFNASRELDGTMLNITIGVESKRKGVWLNDKAKELAGWLKGLNQEDDNTVTKLETKGFVDDEKPEIIDLLGGRLTAEIEVPISTADYRMEIEERWIALYRVFASWKRKGFVR